MLLSLKLSLCILLLIFLNEGLYVHDTDANTTSISLLRYSFLLILRGWPLVIRAVIFLLNLIKGFDALSCALDDRISHCLFHQIHFALSNKLHVSVGQWNL